MTIRKLCLLTFRDSRQSIPYFNPFLKTKSNTHAQLQPHTVDQPYCCIRVSLMCKESAIVFPRHSQMSSKLEQL